MLDPRPRDFTAATDLDRTAILRALTNGRAGTAMEQFTTLISPQEIEDVTSFVLETFIACREHNTSYHTAENGWPDHRERYGPAFPFVLGEIALDAPDEALDATGRAGKDLFRSSCISCHDGRLAHPAPLAISPAASSTASSNQASDDAEPHHGDYDTPTIHDVAPEIPGLTEAELRGKRLYMEACADCHAADGSGMNWVGRFLEPSPPDFTVPDFAARFDPARFAATTLEAPEGTTMPSFGAIFSC